MLRTNYKQNFFFFLPLKIFFPSYLNLETYWIYFLTSTTSNFKCALPTNIFFLFTLAEIHFVLLVYFLNSTLDQNFKEKLLAFISPAK